MGNAQDLTPSEWAKEIDQTKARIDRSWESLGNEVRGTISNISSATKETVRHAKETVSFQYQTEKHPWPMVGAAIATGTIIGSMLRPKNQFGAHSADSTQSNWINPTISTNGHSHTRQSVFGKLTDEFGSELIQLRGLAIGSLIAILRDLGKKSLSPSIAPKFSEVVDSATRKLGGTPI